MLWNFVTENTRCAFQCYFVSTTSDGGKIATETSAVDE